MVIAITAFLAVVDSIPVHVMFVQAIQILLLSEFFSFFGSVWFVLCVSGQLIHHFLLVKEFSKSLQQLQRLAHSSKLINFTSITLVMGILPSAFSSMGSNSPSSHPPSESLLFWWAAALCSVRCSARCSVRSAALGPRT